MLSNTALLTQVLPTSLVNKAVGSVRTFLGTYGDAPLLCIELEGAPGSELEMALNAAVDPTADQANRALAFHTELASAGDSDIQRHVGSFSARELGTRLKVKRHFVLPLIKRAEATLSADRISVGRARNTDVVLRDSSVSKFHAWFEIDDTGVMRVADAGSKNGTLLSGVKLTPRELTAIDYGTPVVFGSISAFVCEPAVLWEAFHKAD